MESTFNIIRTSCFILMLSNECVAPSQDAATPNTGFDISFRRIRTSTMITTTSSSMLAMTATSNIVADPTPSTSDLSFATTSSSITLTNVVPTLSTSDMTTPDMIVTSSMATPSVNDIAMSSSTMIATPSMVADPTSSTSYITILPSAMIATTSNSIGLTNVVPTLSTNDMTTPDMIATSSMVADPTPSTSYITILPSAMIATTSSSIALTNVVLTLSTSGITTLDMIDMTDVVSMIVISSPLPTPAASTTTEILCSPVVDNTWQIDWPKTAAGSLAATNCSGVDSLGYAYRRCQQDGVWESVINVTQCRNAEYINLQNKINNLANSSNSTINVVNEVQSISEELINITNISTGVILPNYLHTTIEIIDTITIITQDSSEALAENDTAEAVDMILDNVATTVNNLLSNTRNVTFTESQNAGLPSLGQDFLRTIERFAVAVGNVTSATNISRNISKDNIIIEAQLVPKNTTLFNEIVFPNDTVSMQKFSGAQITIPSSAVTHQRETEGIAVPVVNFIANNLQLYINDSSLSDKFQSSSGVVISSQISKGPINLTEDDSHVTLRFQLEKTGNAQCVYWDFNNENSSNHTTGRWSSDGIIQDDDPRPPVICRATHLTSFSVLVSSADAAEDSPELHIVNYVGCGVSIVCLLLTIGAIILLRKTAFKANHHMLHLNLFIALLIGLIVFVSAVERAKDWWCNVVAILLHYFFLCVFCWTLCEAIMIYIKFVRVYYEGIFQDIRFFILLGWGIPIPIVAISAGVSYDNYVIYDNDSTTVIACWISDKNGSIWAFVGPVILILLINMTLFTLSLWKIYHSASGEMTQSVKEKYESAKILLLSIIELSPLLGATWLLGLLFIIDNESVVLAWIFTIVNSLQGVGIFFLHVVRSRELRSVIKGKFQNWRKERKWKSSTKDTTMQGESWHSNNFLLENQSLDWVSSECPPTKDDDHQETL